MTVVATMAESTVLLARLGNGRDSYGIGGPHHWCVFRHMPRGLATWKHLLQSCEDRLHSAPTQAQGLAIVYREDADVRAVLAVECVAGDQPSPNKGSADT